MSWLGYAQNAKQSPVCPMIWLGKRNCWHGARSLRFAQWTYWASFRIEASWSLPNDLIGQRCFTKNEPPTETPLGTSSTAQFQKIKDILHCEKVFTLWKIAHYQNLTLWKLYIVKIVQCQGKKDKSKKHALWRHCVVKGCIGNTNFLQKHERARERPKHAFQCQRHGGGFWSSKNYSD